jgi:hypothetical protein
VVPEPLRKSGSRAICGAKTRKGTPCQVPPMKNGRCYRHGGPSLSGPAHANYSSGIYAQNGQRALLEKLPREIRKHSEDLRRSGFDIQSLVGVLEAEYGRLCDLFAQLDSCEAPPWKEAVAGFKALKKGLARVNLPPEIRSDLEAYGERLDNGAAWERIKDKLNFKIGDCLDRIVRMTAVDQDWRLKSKMLIGILDAGQLQKAIIDIAVEVMKDSSIPQGKEQVKAFAQRIEKYVIKFRAEKAPHALPGPMVNGKVVGATESLEAAEP